MRLSIGKKILLALLAVALVPLIVAGFITYRVAERFMKREVISTLSALSESTRGHLLDYVKEEERIITLLAHTPTLIKAIEGYEGLLKRKASSADYAALDRQYRTLHEFYTHFGLNGLYLINTWGDIVFAKSRKEDVGLNVSRGPFKDTELARVFKMVQKTSRIEISEFKIFPITKQPVTFIATPVRKGKKVVGYLALKLGAAGLYKQLSNYKGLGNTGEIVLAGIEGVNIVFVAPTRHDPDAAFKRQVRIGTLSALPMQYALNREDGEGISIDYRDKSIVAVWRYFAPLRLGLVIKQDTSEAFFSVEDIKRWALIIGGITVLFVMAVSAFVARSIARPIQRLHDGTERVGAGDLSYRVGTASRDEIGQLSRAFDEMTLNLDRITASRDELDKEIAERKRAEKNLRESEDRLREYSKNLEKIVEERTGDLKAAQSQLLMKEKLAAIGQLSSSVGHELRNPLGVIGNSVYYLNMKLKDSDDNIKKHLGILAREVRRSNRIISDLLDFSRARALDLRRGDLNALIRETIEGGKVRQNITLDMSCLADLPVFSFDADQIHQLIVNFITNALAAMPDGGRLCIRTGVRDGFAEMSFEDRGMGIPAQDLDKIFEPLYTTRARGTGLGLSIVKGIVERHGGSITVKSKEGEGAVFTVRLPMERSDA